MKLEEIYWHYIVEEYLDDDDVTTSGFQSKGDCGVFVERLHKITEGSVKVYMIIWTDIENRKYEYRDVTNDFV